MLVYPSEPGHYKIKLWHGRFAPAASYETYTTVPVVSAQRTFDIIPTNQSGTPNGNISYVAVQGMQVSSYGLLNQTNGLYSVSMNGCALSSFPYFEGAANIQSLNLAYNGLTAFDGRQFNDLVSFSAPNNSISDLPQFRQFQGTSNISAQNFYLSSLSLAGNPISSADTAQLPSTIASLDLSECQISGSIDVGRFPDTFLYGLETLLINDNSINAITGTFSAKMKTLYIYGNQFSPSEMDSILERLELATRGSGGSGKWLIGNIGIRTSASSSAYSALVSRGWGIINSGY